MDNHRRLLLFCVFAFSLIMLWENWVKLHQPPPPAAPVAQVAADAAGASVAGVDADVPQASTPAGGAAVPEASDAPASAAVAAPYMLVRTDKMLLRISAQGGDLTGLELLEHPVEKGETGYFPLFEDGRNGARHVYLAQSGLSGLAGLPNHTTRFELPAAEMTLAEGEDELIVRLQAAPIAGSPLRLVRTLRFTRDSYLIDITQELTNGGDVPIAPHAYYRFLRDGEPAESHGVFGVRTFTGPAVYTSEHKFQKVEFSHIDDNKAEYAHNAEDGWIAMVQHYFFASWLPEGNIAREFFMRKNGRLYEAGLLVPMTEIAPGATGKTQMRLYAGPQEQTKLAAIAPGLDLVVDYGWLTIIASPLFWVLSWLHRLTGNWGWAIILVTVAIKLIFFPLSAASYRSMAKMRTLAPRMQQLKERYGDDRARLQQEMMEMYRKEKINPLGGCLPMLVQIPVFIALYWVLLGSVEMRHAPWLGWIQDLSAQDPYYILPIIMGIAMFAQMKLNPAPPDPIQARVMMTMPIIFTVMCLWFPSGLVLYWVVNNLLSIAQQWQITRMIEGAKKPANDSRIR